MTLTVKLAKQEKDKLAAIVTAMHATNQSEAVRALINEKFESLQEAMTLAERRGGHPKFLLDGDVKLSERENRKSMVSKAVAAKASRRAN